MSEKYFDALEKGIAAAKDFTADGPMRFLDDLTNNITKAMDRFILDQFERHGYSKEEIVGMVVTGEATAVKHGDETTYLVKGVPLFCIKRCEYDLVDTADDYYNFTARLICHDICTEKGVRL